MRYRRSLNIYQIICDLLIILYQNILILLNIFQFLPRLMIIHRFHYYRYHLKIKNGIFYLEMMKIRMERLFIQVITEDFLAQDQKTYVIYWKISLRFLD